jgi:hypothetical protein
MRHRTQNGRGPTCGPGPPVQLHARTAPNGHLKGAMMMQDQVVLKLSKPEALVFFEWLANIEPMSETICQHHSEEKVLWKIQGQLESNLSDLFADNYADVLEEARRSVESNEA